MIQREPAQMGFRARALEFFLFARKLEQSPGEVGKVAEGYGLARDRLEQLFILPLSTNSSSNFKNLPRGVSDQALRFAFRCKLPCDNV